MIRYFTKYTNGVITSVNVILSEQETAPTNSIEVSKDDYDIALASLADLAVCKTSAKEAIDKKAGEVRMRYVTSVPGQAETYMMKSDEAGRLKAIGYGVDDATLQVSYPVIYGEMLATGASQEVVCETIIATEKAWRSLAAVIERERIQGKLSVSNAATFDDAANAAKAAMESLDNI